MIARDAFVNRDTAPPMMYVLAARCPRPVPVGAPFYACVCGMRVDGAQDAAIMAVCEHTTTDLVAPRAGAHEDARTVFCCYPHPAATETTEVGTPVVYHRHEPSEDDGSTKD